MASEYIETVPFESKYSFHLEGVKKVANGSLIHRVPVDVIIDLGQLECGCIKDRPDTCIPWDPNKPDDIPDIVKKNAIALVKSAVIPPLPYPETFGAIIKEENERWIKVEGQLTVTYANGVLANWTYTYGRQEELCIDDPLLYLAKEVIQDNAKQEQVKVYDSSGKLLGFAEYIDRDVVDRNIWKEQYVMKEMGLPLYLRPKARVPTTTTGSTKFTEDGKEITLTATLPGSDKISYGVDCGTGERSARVGGKDTESHCRCYTMNAIIKPWVHVVNTPFSSPDSAKRTVDDEIYNPINWNDLVYNFLIARVQIPEIEINGRTSAVDTCVAITGIKINEEESTLGALRSALGVNRVTTETVCTDAKRYKIEFPSAILDGALTVTLNLVFFYKIAILKMDMMVNDEYISHIYCGAPETMAPGEGSKIPVPSVYIESVNENL
ncbi:MAG: hypothetical protein QW052_06280 [Candidatus Nitrosocaldaceae archaeon]